MPGQIDHLENLTHSQARQVKRELRRLNIERDAAVQLLHEKIGGSLTGINQLVRDRSDELMEEDRKNEEHKKNRRKRNGRSS